MIPLGDREPAGMMQLQDRGGLRGAALSRWENEGGANRHDADPDALKEGPPPLSNAELVQLQVRVIALENVVIAMLAHASPSTLALVEEMAGFILPRLGSTPHPLTIRAAGEMRSLANRVDHFRTP